MDQGVDVSAEGSRTDTPAPDYDNLPDVGLADQTARAIFAALKEAGALTQQQVDDACEQLVWWRNQAG